MDRPFKRVKKAAWLGGICAGLAYALGVPTWLTRALWLLLFLGAGIGGLIYLVLWLVVPQWPEEPLDYAAVTA
jgi:phage shock protein PspC (stress-responsive transcriptional regulator)